MKRHLDTKLGFVFISLVLILSIFAFMLLNGSTAWFAKNDRVDAGGLSVSINSIPNVIIGKTLEDIEAGSVNPSISFDGVKYENMVAVTRVTDGDEIDSETFLKYVTNHYAVDVKTGNEKKGNDFIFAPAPADGNGIYFIDYTVYIAAVVDEINVDAIMATVSTPGDVSPAHQHEKALSVDFYVGEVSNEGYRGTTAIADGIGEGTRTVNLFPGSVNDDGTVECDSIPLNIDENGDVGYKKIIMRCYFDGALQYKDPETGDYLYAYVNSDTATSDNVAFEVRFFVIEEGEQG